MNPTPEQLQEMWEWYQARKEQQLAYPVDEASKNALGAGVLLGPGSTARTQNIVIGSGGGSAAVPAAYAGTLLVVFEGARYEIPYIATP